MAVAMVSPVPPRPGLRGDAGKRICEAPVGHGPVRIGPVRIGPVRIGPVRMRPVPVPPARRVAVPAAPAVMARAPTVIALAPAVVDEDRLWAGMAPRCAGGHRPCRRARPRLQRCGRHRQDQGERPCRENGLQHRVHDALLSVQASSAGRRPPRPQPDHSGVRSLLSTRSSATVRFASSAASRSAVRSSNRASRTVSGAWSSASRAA